MPEAIGRPGFRIREEISRPDPGLVAELAKYPTSNIADAQERFGFMDPGIRRISGCKLAGTAITVLTRPGDNLMVHKALEVARPGDVVVVSTCRNDNTAVFGEIMATTLRGAGLEGAVVDGAVRDFDELQKMGVKVFARTVVGSACDKDGPGEINYPIACGGVAVLPGDVVIGDSDGVVVVRSQDLPVVLEKVRSISSGEAKRIEEIRRGLLFKPDINRTLSDKGVI
ncbi:MAG: RraA family protein [Bacillota bacterium]